MVPKDTVKTDLHKLIHFVRLSTANICSILMRVSCMSLMSCLSISVSNILNKTPGNPDSVNKNPKTNDKCTYIKIKIIMIIKLIY